MNTIRKACIQIVRRDKDILNEKEQYYMDIRVPVPHNVGNPDVIRSAKYRILWHSNLPTASHEVDLTCSPQQFRAQETRP
jgi:hypothetical protein